MFLNPNLSQSHLSQPDLITDSDSGVHPASHHQIIFAKIKKLFYPTPYLRDVQHYQDGYTNLIGRAINTFDWERAFINDSFNEKVFILNKTILNISNFNFLNVSNFIQHETMTIDDKTPLGLKKNKISSKRRTVFKKTIKLVKTITIYNSWRDWNFFKKNEIEVSKLNYYSRVTYKLKHIQKNSKVYGYY